LGGITTKLYHCKFSRHQDLKKFSINGGDDDNNETFDLREGQNKNGMKITFRSPCQKNLKFTFEIFYLLLDQFSKVPKTFYDWFSTVPNSGL